MPRSRHRIFVVVPSLLDFSEDSNLNMNGSTAHCAPYLTVQPWPLDDLYQRPSFLRVAAGVITAFTKPKVLVQPVLFSLPLTCRCYGLGGIYDVSPPLEEYVLTRVSICRSEAPFLYGTMYHTYIVSIYGHQPVTEKVWNTSKNK